MGISSTFVRVAVIVLTAALITLLTVILGGGDPAAGLSTATKIYVG